MSSKPSILLDFSLLKTNRAFRAVFCARFISIVALGLMAIAIPVQIQALTGSTPAGRAGGDAGRRRHVRRAADGRRIGRSL